MDTGDGRTEEERDKRERQAPLFVKGDANISEEIERHFPSRENEHVVITKCALGLGDTQRHVILRYFRDLGIQQDLN